MSSGASLWLSPRRPRLNKTGTTAPTHGCITPLPGNVPADGCACRRSRPRARYPKQAACSNRRAFRPLRRMRHTGGSPLSGEVCENPDGESVAWLRLPHSAIADASRDAELEGFGGSGEIRTRDQRIKSPLLYRLSYRPPFEEGRMLATTPPPVKLQPPLLQGPWTTRGDCASGHAPGAPVAIHPAPCWAGGRYGRYTGLGSQWTAVFEKSLPGTSVSLLVASERSGMRDLSVTWP
jgi:hypothetical protein